MILHHGLLRTNLPDTRQTNGFIEAITGLFQAAKRKARGYMCFETMRTALLRLPTIVFPTVRSEPLLEATHVQRLDDLRKQEIAKHRYRKPQPIAARQTHEAE